MLALLIGLLVSLGPLLRGGWDLWAQSLLFVMVAAGFTVWLAGRILVGFVPRPSDQSLVLAGVLAGLSGLSAFSSPVWAYSVPAWRALLLGLWIFPALDAVSKDGRAAVDGAIRIGAWVLVLLAFYQRWHDGIARPPASLLNQNVFAGTALMLLPIAGQKGDWPLLGALLVALCWAHSVGAWLGLAAALVLVRRGWLSSRAGAAIASVCAVVLLGRLHDPELLNRLRWWAAAGRLIARRPWLGYGPGSFGYVFPSAAGAGLRSLFAHQYALETGAECGLLYLAVWALALTRLLRRGGEHKRFGAVAALVQSLWDYPLSIPANFWLFCYLAASSGSQTSRGYNVPSRRKAPLVLLTLAVGLSACGWAWRRWEADRLKAAAFELAGRGAAPQAVLPVLARAAGLAPDPDAERGLADLELALGRPLDALGHLRRAARLDPYRASTAAAVERLSRELAGRAP